MKEVNSKGEGNTQTNMTMSQKILADHAGVSSVKPGDLIQAKLDLLLANDVTTPVIIDEFKNAGFKKVFDPEKFAIVLDHFTPNKDIAAAEQSKKCRDFAKKNKITNFFDVGEVGIEHAILPEKGLVAPGDLIIGADSHTCTYGALGAFGTGVGSTDIAASLGTGVCWFKVPEAIKVELSNKPQKWVSGKDIILNIIGELGVDGATYDSLEFVGSGLGNLTIDDRFTMANMAVEAGAKNGIFAIDEITEEYLKQRVNRPYKVYQADANAQYKKVIKLDLSKIEPTVACPHLPSNIKNADKLNNIKIDQAIIGSCTNGRLSDLRIAAEVLKDKKVAPYVRTIIIPASQEIYLNAAKEGLLEIFVEAGCAISPPTCGPCMGGHMGVLAKGEKAISTSNRNFIGRMGHKESEVYLANPAIAAASALAGYITIPDYN